MIFMLGDILNLNKFESETKLNKYEILLFELLLCCKIQPLFEKIVKLKVFRVHIEKTLLEL